MKFRKPRIRIFKITLAAFLAVSALMILFLGEKKQRTPFYDQQISAAKMMADCIAALRRAPFDSAALKFDPNRTNLIGREYSLITTTLGDLPAKRTATNPDFAAFIVKWLHELKVDSGATIAIGSSGSFPSLTLATLCAAKAMNLQPILIVSLGASTFGTNRPDFTYLDMENFLFERGLISQKSTAVSLGGSDDLSGGLLPEGIQLLRAAVERNHAQLISAKDFSKNVCKRGKIYLTNGSPAVFVNIGGARINIGDYETANRLKPGINGLHWKISKPKSMVAFFAARKIPIIHLLNIKKIALENGLPIDPVPLPMPGESGIYFIQRSSFMIASVVFFLIISGWILVIRK